MSAGDFHRLATQGLRQVGAAAACAALLLATAGSAAAGGSIKDAPVPEGRKLEWSFNVGATSDYVFRGISQTSADPAVQGGFDMTYGWFYAGAWMSTIDFGKNGIGKNIVWSEVDLYAGIKPKFGMFTFDFGGIYYAYPGGKDAGAELDYVELKAGVSVNPIKPLTVGVTGFWSPEYTLKQGEVWTVEGSAAYELPKFHIFTPTISGLVGYQKGDIGDGYVTAGASDDYTYWNAGLALAVDKLTLDFRYWDTNIKGICGGPVFQCDERFVFSVKATLP